MQHMYTMNNKQQHSYWHHSPLKLSDNYSLLIIIYIIISSVYNCK